MYSVASVGVQTKISQILWVNNSRIFRIKNVKFSEHCFYGNTKIYGYRSICICVSLSIFLKSFSVVHCSKLVF